MDGPAHSRGQVSLRSIVLLSPVLGELDFMRKDTEIANLLETVPNKKCRRCRVETEFAAFGDLSVLCGDCEKIEKQLVDAGELTEFERRPVTYDIDEILKDSEYYDVLARFADSFRIPEQHLLPCERVPTFIGRLSCDWRNGFYDMVTESHHSVLFQVLPSLDCCGAARAAEAVSECLDVLDRFGYRRLITEFEEPYYELSESDQGALDEALRQLDSKWKLFREIDSEMQIAAHKWVSDHQDDFHARKPNKA